MKGNMCCEDDLYFGYSKDRFSATTCGSNSIEENTEGDFYQGHQMIRVNEDLRFELFENYDHLPEISQKMCQRAVSWIMTACWTRNLTNQCLWTALLLFYSLKAQKKIKKDQLQLTMLTCLAISLKLITPGILSLKDLIPLCSKNIQLKEVVQMQYSILLQLNFNVVIPHYIGEIYSCCKLPLQKVNKLEYICQLLMIKNHKIFLDRQKIQKLIKIMTDWDEDYSFQLHKDIKEQIKSILSLKESKIVLNKYSPKFDILTFNNSFI